MLIKFDDHLKIFFLINILDHACMKMACCSGGGKDLATAAAIMETREQKFKQEDLKPEMKMGHMPMGFSPKMGANMHPSTYDMMRNPPSKYN